MPEPDRIDRRRAALIAYDVCRRALAPSDPARRLAMSLNTATNRSYAPIQKWGLICPKKGASREQRSRRDVGHR